MAVDKDRISDHILCAAKLLLPDAKAENHGQTGTGEAILVFGKRPTPSEFHPQRLKVIRSDGVANEGPVAVLPTYRQPFRPEPDKRVDRLDLF